MCGIAGVIERPARAQRGELGRRAALMGAALGHRGPDGQGVWVPEGGSPWHDEGSGVALAHARLSILELSPLGAQPMRSDDGRLILVFNGEIYNFRELRAELEAEGCRFHGGSDTEVLLRLLERVGPAQALPRLEGMFAFALWDRREEALWLARDRIGEKPLYYGWAGGQFLFGSELAALRACPGFGAPLDRAALSLYFRYACVPAPWSIFEGIRKLPPGCYARLGRGETSGPEPRPYWSLDSMIAEAREAPFEGGEAQAIERLDELLGRAVAARMVSDVPLGAFLSGGIDSSLTVALMQRQSGRRVRTFTVGFDEKDYDEGAQARAVAAHLGTEHSEERISAQSALRAIPELARVGGEPLADPSLLATCLLARHARGQVTVALSGDGGDELFAGYHRHFLAERAWGGLRRLPREARRAGAGALGLVPARAWEGLARLRPGAKPAIFSDQVRKAIDCLPAASPWDLYSRLLAHQRPPERLLLGESAPEWRPGGEPPLGISELFQYWDTLTFLPDDVLAKVDRATMAAGLEARVPFLDSAVTKFAWSLPRGLKQRDGLGKWLPRRLLARYLPEELIQRPKLGFRVPLGGWLRGELRDWCETCLDRRLLREQGYLDPEAVGRLWEDHLSGRREREFALWSVLMFQSWLGRGVA